MCGGFQHVLGQTEPHNTWGLQFARTVSMHMAPMMSPSKCDSPKERGGTQYDEVPRLWRELVHGGRPPVK